MSDKWISFQSFVNDLHLIEATNDLIISLKLKADKDENSPIFNKAKNASQALLNFLNECKSVNMANDMRLTGLNPRTIALIEMISKKDLKLIEDQNLSEMLEKNFKHEIDDTERSELIEHLTSLREILSSHHTTNVSEIVGEF